MTKELIDTKKLEIDAEFINNAMEMAERGAAMAVTGAIQAGGRLNEVKEHVPHGEWSAWIGRNLNYSQEKAIRYMRIASNSSCVTNLKDAKSINEALRMIADDKEEKTAPRSERKSGQVTISTAPGSHKEASGNVQDEPDDDPTPDPPTNRKTAKGSEKVSEDKKPRTQTVVPEILPDDDDEDDPIDDWFATRSLEDVCKKWLGPPDDATANKSAAKHLRKLADKLDPPTKFVKPDLDDVSAYFSELKAIDPDSFFDFYESKGWMVGKTSMKDWRASARKWVRENALNKKANNNGRRTAETNDPASCLGPNGRPRVERAKITYK